MEEKMSTDYSKLGLEGFKVKTDEEYWNEVDPRTGQRYAILFLSPLNPNYKNEYIYYMKMKQISPDQFARMNSWD